MSGDEVMLLLFSVVVTAYTWYRWYSASFVRTLVARNTSRLIYVTGPVVCLILLYLVLRRWAADDVRDSETYLTLYMFVGAAWVGFTARLFGLLGISPRDDAVERQNSAAAFAMAGALAGITFCFAGANIGNGPGWWVVIFSAVLSTGVFFLLWVLVEKFTGVSESVTVERNGSSGLRLGGFLAGTGLILGRAVAGDWVSAGATIRDFMMVAWPVLPLTWAAVIVERVSPLDAGSPADGTPMAWLVSSVFVAVACLYIFLWQGMP